MATDLEIAQRIGKAVAEGLEDDPSVARMYKRLLTMAAGFAAGMGDDPLVCEEHFVQFARGVYQYARNPPVVECTKCHQKNRLKAGPSTLSVPICAVCKSSLLPGLMGFLHPQAPADPSN